MSLTAIQILKIRLMVEGLSLSQEVRSAIPGPLTLADYASTSGLTLRLEDDIWVNAPFIDFNPNFVTNPESELIIDQGELYIQSEELGVKVRAWFIPVPNYHDKKNQRGELYTSFGITHSDRVRISPIAGCAITCTFCDSPYTLRYKTKDAADLIETTNIALHDEQLPAKHVMISGGTPKPEDYDYLNEVYEKVVEAFPRINIDVMMIPIPGLLDAQHLKDIGIHSLCINIEMFNQELARRVMSGKWRTSRERYLKFIEGAVRIFGEDGVRSLILVGIEPLEDTLKGVEALAQIGCDPVLRPFRPDPATPMRDVPPPSVELLIEAYEKSEEIVARHGVKLGPRCIPCMHNTLTFPDDSGKYYYS